jgi:hypothetical protein
VVLKHLVGRPGVPLIGSAVVRCPPALSRRQRQHGRWGLERLLTGLCHMPIDLVKGPTYLSLGLGYEPVRLAFSI